ncbi:hypothetical protein O3P69_008719 [Scylla paramamosain]|uniref:Uncharacterized protein n=1 Tax=Scylla paramamosain TaxID=85552 RepID=A0AAW0SPZ0_SCYPA
MRLNYPPVPYFEPARLASSFADLIPASRCGGEIISGPCVVWSQSGFEARGTRQAAGERLQRASARDNSRSPQTLTTRRATCSTWKSTFIITTLDTFLGSGEVARNKVNDCEQPSTATVQEP